MSKDCRSRRSNAAFSRRRAAFVSSIAIGRRQCIVRANVPGFWPFLGSVEKRRDHVYLSSAQATVDLRWDCGRLRFDLPSARGRRTGCSGRSAAMPSSGVIWLLLAAIVVMFMHIGFAMIETGFCRAKNALNTVTMNLMIFPLSCLAFWVYGFAVGWGNFSTRQPWPRAGPPRLDLPGTILNRGLGSFPCWTRPARRPADTPTAWSAPRGSSFPAWNTEHRPRPAALGLFLLHDGPDRQSGPHSRGGDGRTLAVEELLPLRAVGRAAADAVRELGLGRRLAGPHRAQLAAGPRRGRFLRRRRDPRPGRRDRAWSAPGSSAPAWENIVRAVPNPCPATTFPWWSSAA